MPNNSYDEIISTHNLYLVKWNKDNKVRLARFTDLLAEVPQEDRLEIEVQDLTDEEAKNPLWQKDMIIWFSPTEDFWAEATQDDDKAKEEYQSVLDNLHKFPDLQPQAPQSYGTLIILSKTEKGFTVVDGVNRTLKPN